jgi:hypothetical protein
VGLRAVNSKPRKERQNKDSQTRRSRQGAVKHCPEAFQERFWKKICAKIDLWPRSRPQISLAIKAILICLIERTFNGFALSGYVTIPHCCIHRPPKIIL